MILIRKLKRVYETRRRRKLIQAAATDYHRWSHPASFSEAWSVRSRAALELRGGATWIAEIGCGRQDIRKQLPSGAKYLPMDLTQWTEDTLFCDINAKLLPAKYLELCDVCYALGVLEYIYEPLWLFQMLGRQTERIVVSYCPPETMKVDRPANGWVNSYSVNDLLALIQQSPFTAIRTADCQGQILIEAINGNFDDSLRQARAEARTRFLANAAGVKESVDTMASA